MTFHLERSSVDPVKSSKKIVALAACGAGTATRSVRTRAAAARVITRYLLPYRNGPRRTCLLHRKAGDPAWPVHLPQVPPGRRLQHPLGAPDEKGPAAGWRQRRRSREVREAPRLYSAAGRRGRLPDVRQEVRNSIAAVDGVRRSARRASERRGTRARDRGGGGGQRGGGRRSKETGNSGGLPAEFEQL